MSTLSILILAALLLFIGLLFGFIAGLDWRDHQARAERRQMYISRNGKLLRAGDRFNDHNHGA